MGFSLAFGTVPSGANHLLSSPRCKRCSIENQWKFNLDASGCDGRFGPDGTVEKAGERPDFRRWHFADVRLAREIGEMNSGENRRRTPELFRRASIRRGEAELPKAGASAVREWNHTPEPPAAPTSIRRLLQDCVTKRYFQMERARTMSEKRTLAAFESLSVPITMRIAQDSNWA